MSTSATTRRASLLGISTLACLWAVQGCEGPLPEDDVTTVEQAVLAPGGFSGWRPIPGGVFNEGPAILSTLPGQLLVLGRGTDNKYYGSAFGSGAWEAWTAFPGNGIFSSKPAMTAVPKFGAAFIQRAYLGKGLDNAIWSNVCVGGGNCTHLAAWQKIAGGPFVDAPAIVFRSPFLYAFARKADQQIYWSRNDITQGYVVGNWSAWTGIPAGLLSSGPAAVTSGSNVYVAARGLDGFAYITKFNGTSWGLWNKVLGSFPDIVGEPALAQFPNGDVHIFGRATDNTYFVVTHDTVFNDFFGKQRLNSGTFQSAPGAWSWGPGHVDIVGRGGDNRIWIDTYQE
jgi:hypothetical protein